ncbi:MAG: DotU family type IV/VI secretion system protein [Azoarcus sp.]|jgi:type VI secretion system protein ImpK|nr:DotU family type IV/VI secretion system protein [Azoarcus sp.]MDD2874210.1 DotU family type IV/VI secretion system protein [Azoarcus sp.]
MNSPTLVLAGPVSPSVDAAPQAQPHPTLVDLLYEGFYMVFLLRNGKSPSSCTDFSERVKTFLADFERQAKRFDYTPEDIFDSKYAFSALVDEAVLSSNFPLRSDWERQPLQLTLFGDQLAGEHFFERMEKARDIGKPRLPGLEVFQMCLLLGFKGKYRIEGAEKLNYLGAQLGNQIAHIKGKHAGFAPHWRAADSIAHALRHEIPVWVVVSFLALAGLFAYIGINTKIDDLTRKDMALHSNVVSFVRNLPSITITLP